MNNFADIEALTFDVFGTVVDWRKCIAREGRRIGEEKGVDSDWEKFADDWRGGYEPTMNRVRNGELPWAPIDSLHRMILDELLDKYGLCDLTEEEKSFLNKAWHRLKPWDDVLEGLERLRSGFIVAALSNGNIALLTNMAKHSNIPWDCILSAELSKHYKPDPEGYISATELLGLTPEKVMMVAAHPHDLNGAKAIGMRTAFVHRSLEFGIDQTVDLPPKNQFDLSVSNFIELAEALAY